MEVRYRYFVLRKLFEAYRSVTSVFVIRNIATSHGEKLKALDWTHHESCYRQKLQNLNGRPHQIFTLLLGPLCATEQWSGCLSNRWGVEKLSCKVQVAVSFRLNSFVALRLFC